MTDKEVLAKATAEIERRIKNLVQTEEEENDLKLNYPEQYGIVQGYRAAVTVLESMQEGPEIKLGDRIRIKGSTTKGDIVTNIYQAGDGNTYFEFMNSDDAPADDRWELVEETASKQSVEESIAEVEEKAKAFTEAHKGESADAILTEMRGEEPVGDVWHDSNKDQPGYGRTVAVWSPKTMDGDIITRCTKVYPDRMWAYIEDLLKLDNNLTKEPVSKDLEE